MALVRFQYSAAMMAALVGLCLGASRAGADEVDDLLAGRPVSIDSTAIYSAAAESLTIDLVGEEKPSTTFTSSLEVTSVASSSPNSPNHKVAAADVQGSEASHVWNMSIGSTADHGLGRAAEQVEVPGFAISQVSIVPEPSAIALGVLAMIYFLLFFRRHHWVA